MKNNHLKIINHFDNYGSDNFFSIVENIIDRATIDKSEYNDFDELIYDAVDNELIYSDDQWEIMKHYQSPNEANFDEAVEMLINDIFAIVGE